MHGDISQGQRTTAVERFKSGEVPLLVATDVAARGLDIPDVEVGAAWAIGGSCCMGDRAWVLHGREQAGAWGGCECGGAGVGHPRPSR